MALKQVNGIKVAYDEIGSGDPIVLVHGWSANRSALRFIAERLGENHHVVNLDLRGHGESTTTDDEVTMELMAADVVALCAELGLERPTLVGHSMGGGIVLQAAADRPEAVGAIVMLDPPTLEPSAESEAMAGELTAGLEADLAATREGFIRSMALPNADPAVVEEVLVTAATNADEDVLRAWGALGSFDPQALGPRVQCPALHLAATPGFNTRESIERLLPDSVFGQTVGVGHLFVLDDPDQISTMIEAFLREYVDT